MTVPACVVALAMGGAYVPGEMTLGAGSHQWEVPPGVYALTYTLVAGGGGGGGSVASGDCHGAANGGSGGYWQNKVLEVVPGQKIEVTVGAGGLGGTGSQQGARGASSSMRKDGSLVCEATGGYGGRGVSGDNSPGNANNGSLGGSPNGVDGSWTASWMTSRNINKQGYDGKGVNPTGYGSGGLGGFSGPGMAGGDGVFRVVW